MRADKSKGSAYIRACAAGLHPGRANGTQKEARAPWLRALLRWLPWAMIAAGLAVGAYAIFARLSVSSEQQRLIALYRDSEQGEAAESPGATAPAAEVSAVVSALPDPDAAEPSAGENTSPATLAVLSIPSIDLEVAVREGVGSWSLRYSVGHYTPSAMPGEAGNCVIMGHRNYTYGEFFNRLDELKAGDTLVFDEGRHRLYVHRDRNLRG